MKAWLRRFIQCSISSRSVAASVAQGVQAQGIPVALARLETGGRVLWACFAGPYKEMEKAKNVRDRIRQKHEFAAAWVKPVNQLPLIGLNDETFEK